jgi:TonB family protein
MIRTLAFLMFLTAIPALAGNKGDCPAIPAPKPKEIPAKSPHNSKPAEDAEFAGTVWLQTVISDKGYVCSVQVLRGFDKVADEQALRSVRQWHFNPARHAGQPVTVIVLIDVNFWRKPNGDLIQVPASGNDPGK